ncbi:MAG: SigE family RNA polymerase sigma factor [Kibdelosporangium sp.]
MRDVAELYRQEWPGLLRLAVLLTGDRGQAEDLVQDAFVALQRRFHRLTDPASAAGYLRVSVVNGARSAHRRQLVAWRHQRVEPSGQPPLDDGLLLAEEHQEVLRAVRRLPRRQQEVLILRYWSGLSEAEIATTLGVSRGTVKTCAARALATLGNRLGVHHD